MPRRRKSIPPIEKFPLHPRADGRYQKRIRNQIFYFTGSRDEARAEYDSVKDDLYAGRPVGVCAEDRDSLMLANIGDMFMDEKEAERDAGRITKDWCADCDSAIRRFMAFKPRGSLKFKSLNCKSLRRADLAAYARHLHSKLGVHAFNRERSVIAAMFSMAAEEEWIDQPIRLGRRFKKRTAGEGRTSAKDWLLSVDAIRRLLINAGPQFRAMILLGLNGGFGPGDCAALKWVYIDAGRVRFFRPKTGIKRDFILWPETVAALAEVRAIRPADDLVFRTAYGNPWTTNAIDHEFVKLVEAARVRLPSGVGPNSFRHTFATYANEIQDTDAYKRIMGRKIASGIDETYVDAIFLPRLKRVVNHVRNRLQIGKSALARRPKNTPPAVA